MESLVVDFRSSLRALGRRPVFSALVILVLALGIGANTALFSLVHGALLAPLGYDDEERLAWIAARDARNGLEWTSLALPDLWYLEDHATSIDALGFWAWNQMTLEEPGQVQQVRGLLVSDNLFGLLGIEPAFGRSFVEDDLVPGRGTVALVGHDLWQNVLGGRDDILGRRLPIDGQWVTVVGVLGPDQGFPTANADLWLPVGRIDEPHGRFGRDERDFLALARLAPGVEREQSELELANLAQQLETQFPESNAGVGVAVRPLRDIFVRSSRGPILIAFGAVTLVLLIACVNVANLMLARAVGRRREWAIRQALGAGKARLAQQQLVEALTLTLAGGAAGLLTALWLHDLLVALGNEFLPRDTTFAFNAPVFLFALGVSLVIGTALGLALSSGSGFATALRDGRRTVGLDRRTGRLRAMMVGGQVALAMSLLAAASTLGMALHDLTRVDLGFDPENLYFAHVVLDIESYPTLDARRVYYRAALDAVRNAPGVTSAALVSALPVPGLGIQMSVPFRGADDPPIDTAEAPRAALRIASPGYLTTAGLQLLEGRDLADQDRSTTAPVALINQSLARRLTDGSGSAVGQRLTYAFGGRSEVEVVGVVGDTRHAGLDRPAEPALFVPHAQLSFLGMGVVARSPLPRESYRRTLDEALLSVNANQPPGQVMSVPAELASTVSTERFSAQILTVFAVVALLLSALGLYATFLFWVGERVQEIGVRMTLGADAGRVARQVVGRGLEVTCAGLLPGLLLAWGLQGVLTNTFQGVDGIRWTHLTVVALVLLVVAALACLAPARRASRVDPIEALRAD